MSLVNKKKDSQVVIICFWTFVFFSSDVLLRCLYMEDFVETVCFRIFDFSNLGPALVLIWYVVVVVVVNIRLQSVLFVMYWLLSIYKPIMLISTFGGVRQHRPVWVDPGPGHVSWCMGQLTLSCLALLQWGQLSAHFSGSHLDQGKLKRTTSPP